jgi:probable addiction module antidote protein
MSRESLYRALGDKGDPGFSTVLRVAQALGLRLTTAPAE